MKAFCFTLVPYLLFSCPLLGDEPYLLQGVFIQDGSGDLSVSYGAAPTITDWNSDSRKDLVVGQYIQGHIWVFLNQGTDLNPVFDGGTMIESNGVPITTTYG